MIMHSFYIGVVLLSLWVAVCAQNVQRGFLPAPCQVYGCAVPDATCNQVSGRCENCGTVLATQGVDHQCTHSATPVPTSCSCTTGNTIQDTQATPVDVCTADDVCLCQVGFTGNNCADNRVKIDCTNNDELGIVITPYGYPGTTPVGFRGRMYLKTDTSFTESNLQAIPSACKTAAGAGTWSLIVAASGQPCTAITTSAIEDYTFLYIQHDPDVRSIHDQVVRLSCFGGVDVPTTAAFTVSDLDVGTLTPIDGTVATGTAITDLSVSLKLDNGDYSWSSITDGDTLRVGDPISLVIERNDQQLFQVVRCKAQNYAFDADNEANLNLRSLTFFDGGCVPREAAHLYRGPVEFTAGDGTEELRSYGVTDLNKEVMRLDLRAFFFLGESQNIYISCLIADGTGTYGSGSVTCDNALVNPPSTNWVDYTARRRRDTSEHDNIVDELQLYITVYERGEGPDKANDDGPSSAESECYKRTSVLLPIILLAALLLVTMVMTFFFCMKVTRFQDQQQKMSHDNMSYKS